MRKLLFIVIIVALCVLLSKSAHADSVFSDVSIGDQSVVSYGLGIQKDWSNVYVNLENAIAGDASSSTTTAAIGVEGMGLNMGLYGGDKFITGQAIPLFGVELGNSFPLGKSGFFLKDSFRIGRQTGSNLTYGSISAGVGLTL